ncbi:MAG: sporulation protein YabP [Bacillota bacterium]
MDEKTGNKLVLTDRRLLFLEGVEHVGTFNENEIALDTNMGFLALRGQGLHITQLNLEEGKMVVEGVIASLEFIENKSAKGARSRGKGMLSRIMK